MVLALRHGLLPRTLHADTPTTRVDWDRGAVRLLSEARHWPREDGRQRRAGISSFGISGTNAHLILAEAPDPAQDPDPAPAREPGDATSPEGSAHPAATVPWLVSAKDGDALRGQARRLAAHAAAHPELSGRDIAYSLLTTRTLHPRAAVLTGDDRDGLRAAAEAFARGETPGSAVRTLPGATAETAFVFTGQGSQRPGMGRGLAAAFPVFDAALREVCDLLDPLLERPLTEVMWAPPGSEEAASLDGTGYAQPALFAFEVALYRLLESWGTVPDRLVGHSVGEIAAAHVAGVLSLGDACALVAARGRLMRALPPGGTMVAVGCSEAEVLPLLADRTHEVAVAAVNGPRSVVLSGAREPLSELTAELSAAGHRTRLLAVSHAFHSPLMEPTLAAFRETVAGLSFHAPTVPLVSCVTGRPLTARQPATRSTGYATSGTRCGSPTRSTDWPRNAPPSTSSWARRRPSPRWSRSAWARGSRPPRPWWCRRCAAGTARTRRVPFSPPPYACTRRDSRWTGGRPCRERARWICPPTPSSTRRTGWPRCPPRRWPWGRRRRPPRPATPGPSWRSGWPSCPRTRPRRWSSIWCGASWRPWWAVNSPPTPGRTPCSPTSASPP
ncbi:acyltransferase domain-containing protein [Streptomyces sp. SS52]|uniref:acyltransferase domain-containing protein n=1 Tax=Streptomyces sp. SS52 TaxID=2563602 RepID=UPI0032B5A60D